MTTRLNYQFVTHAVLMLAIIAVALLAGCDGDGAVITNPYNVSGSGQVVTIDQPKKIDLIISGANNTITIKSNIGSLIVSGADNILKFANGVTVDSCTVSGADNSASYLATGDQPVAATQNCMLTGSNNSGFTQPPAPTPTT